MMKSSHNIIEYFDVTISYEIWITYAHVGPFVHSFTNEKRNEI